ncbi:ATP-binding protein [Micromonospora krabiensis]|uniref:AAA ATPase domain-containing protein n=1 Tax=Micromonospora krabiensis TaxID=307121 RepID=A0A1C3N4J5_9ACTN|nr:ATP-binding protein [Micromonospora krabiensis]SBV27510.1 AAA ATPase domain-containing protein [Micromonospora krabiensis]
MPRVNPYQNVGQPARGDRFVGREDLVSRVRGIIEGDRPSNMSIIGNHRTGKTSLIYRSLIDVPAVRPDLAVVLVGIGKVERIEDVFRLIGRATVNALGALPNRDLDGLATTLEALETEPSWYGIMNQFTKLFGTIHRRGLKVLIVLDEFDRINLAGVQTAHFQLLRDLCTEDWSSTGLVTISRQRVKTLEIGSTNGSCLDQVLAVRTYTKLFEPAEQRAMLRRAGAVGVELEPHVEWITRLAGRHPYLLELLCYELVESSVDIDMAYRNVRSAYADFFARLIRIIDADLGGSGVDKLYQVVDGVGLDVSLDDALALVRYGLVVEAADKSLVPFSEEFGRYLLSIADGRDFRSLWLDCEVGLRRLIRSVLAKAAPDGDSLRLLPASFSKILTDARSRQNRYGPALDSSLDTIDYLNPNDLFQIIVVRWDLFEPVLGESRGVWQRRGEALIRARNEVMHIRPIPAEFRLPAQAAAATIVTILRKLGHVHPAPALGATA